MNATTEVSTCNPILGHLVETVLFIGTDDNDEPLDANYDISDFDKESLSKLYTKFQQFIDKCEAVVTAELGSDWESLEDFYLGGYPDGCVERDFVFTVSGCGVGFWEKGRWDERVSGMLAKCAHEYRELEYNPPYVGDDGKIYFM